MNTAQKIMLSIPLCMLTTFTCVSTYADVPDISGNYTCTGNDPSSTPPAYTDNMVIKKNGNVYSFRYIQTGSVTPYLLGTGFASKDVNNVVSLIYWDPTNLGGATEAYFVKPDGSLDGVFAGSKKTATGTELCKKTT